MTNSGKHCGNFFFCYFVFKNPSAADVYPDQGYCKPFVFRIIKKLQHLNLFSVTVYNVLFDTNWGNFPFPDKIFTPNNRCTSGDAFHSYSMFLVQRN